MARIVVFIYLFFVLSSYLAYAQDDNETISTTTPTTTTTTSEPQENQEQETETAEEVQCKLKVCRIRLPTAVVRQVVACQIVNLK